MGQGSSAPVVVPRTNARRGNASSSTSTADIPPSSSSSSLDSDISQQTTFSSSHSLEPVPKSPREFLIELSFSLVSACALYVAYELFADQLQAKFGRQGKEKKGASTRLQEMARRRLKKDDKDVDVPPLELNDHELVQAENVIDPENLVTSFKDIGGIDSIKQEIYDLVVLPFLRPDLFTSASGLVAPPKGVLLYGSPGTGKTLLAKAIAKESNAAFINVRLSST